MPGPANGDLTHLAKMAVCNGVYRWSSRLFKWYPTANLPSPSADASATKRPHADADPSRAKSCSGKSV